MGPGREALVERSLDEPDEAGPAPSLERAGSFARWSNRLPGWATRRPGRAVWVSGTVILVVLIALVAWFTLRTTEQPITRAEIAAGIQQGIEKAQDEQRNAPPVAAQVFQTILPSLVTVTTKGGSLGTGVVVKEDGTILTALHVVQAGGEIDVEFTDGTKTTARLIDKQPDEDMAVLAPAGLPGVVVPAVIGGGANVGDDVFAAGNPFGLRNSLTAGVVSGLDRSTSVQGELDLHGLIQFDAAVNPGNSGGPLLDRNAQVIGIVTGLANPTESPNFIGIGFAVPIDVAGGGTGTPRK